MNKKAIRIFLISLAIISAIVFVGLFDRSNKSSTRWYNLEINGQINNFVHIDKSTFIQLDTFWFSVNYSSVFEKINPLGCNFDKKREDNYYQIICSDSEMRIWSGSGGVVEDKIWLRRIDMALKKKERQTNK